MSDPLDNERLAELAEAADDDPALAAWIAERPELAGELERARATRRQLAGLRDAEFAPPPGLRARVMRRVQGDASASQLLDLGLGGFGRAILELLGAIFGLLPAAPGPRAAGD